MRSGRAVHRFLVAPEDVSHGVVQGGRVLEWIDEVAHGCAASWSGSCCVAAYVGNVRFRRPLRVGRLVELRATLVHTGRSSMHVVVTVDDVDPTTDQRERATECLTVFVAVDDERHSVAVPPFEPESAAGRADQTGAVRRVALRRSIEDEMARQTCSGAGTAPESVLRSLVAPEDVGPDGYLHGGVVMRWMDEAASACASGFSGGPVVTVCAGGVRFYRPLHLGHLVELRARLLVTGRTSVHVAVRVASSAHGGPSRESAHCLMVLVALDAEGAVREVPTWHPVSGEDRALAEHARTLTVMRRRIDAAPAGTGR